MQNIADIYPLSPTQLGMLFHTLAQPQPGVYVNQYTGHIQGGIDLSHFRQAWQQTVDRHPVLRTAVVWEGLDDPLQVVRESVELPWTYLDWQHLSPTAQSTELQQWLQTDRHQGFDLAQAPLHRFCMIQLSQDAYQFVWSFHHLLFDGWSLPIIWQDLLTAYRARQQNITAQLTPCPPYRNYIAWQQAQDHTAAEQFWRAQLQDFTEPTVLPAARTGKKLAAQAYQQQKQLLDLKQHKALVTFARQHQLTLNTVVQGLWAILLSHYSGNEQVTYGCVMSGRSTEVADIENMVGLFINTLPVCTRIAPQQSLIDWLQMRQTQLLQIQQHESTPLADIQTWSQLSTGQPLFESIVAFENYPNSAAQDLDFTIDNVQYLEQSNYPLALLIVPGESLEFILLYDSGRFADGAITHLLDHLQQLIAVTIQQPHSRLADLPRTNPILQAQYTQGPHIDYPGDRCIHQLIESQAQQTPQAIAVRFDDQAITYSELDQQAHQLAHYLRTQGIQPGDRVALCIPRSVEMIVSIVAILKAGAAYIPLDPSYPIERLEYCLNDSQPKVLLTNSAIDISQSATPRLNLDELAETIPATAANDSIELDRSDDISVENLAYIIYTSGSTGKPKGVMVSHRNLVHSTIARFYVYNDAVERFLLLSSIAFDSSVAGIFWTLCQGGTLVIAPKRIEQDLTQLAQLIRQHQITHTLCVPTVYGLLVEAAPVEDLQSLQTVIVAGEACPRHLAQQHYTKLPGTNLYNEYGPTEATVWCTAKPVPMRQTAGPVAIGNPIPNVQIQICDQHQQAVPIGAIGELYIGGDGVSCGYLDQPNLNATAFVELTTPKQPAQRFYRSGDLARFRSDGSIEWLGRIDRQIKLRGYRIELEEIEATLQTHPAVQNAIVVAPPSQRHSVEQLATALATLEPTHAAAILKTVEEGY